MRKELNRLKEYMAKINKNIIIEKCRTIRSPMVSVGMLVFNQKKYVSIAIESILNQQVNFEYEIVIADDASTDGTREILIEYAKKYPQIIKLILQKNNVGLVENSKILKRACKGRYRATLEGDDFWIDNDRLQKQVDFLETNLDYVAICGLLIPINENSSETVFPWGGLEKNYKLKGDYTLTDFEKWLLPSHVGAWLAYNWYYVLDEKEFSLYESYNFPGDRKTPLFTLMLGKIYVEANYYMARRLLWNSKSSHIATLKTVSNAAYKVFCWTVESEKMDKSLLKMGLNMTNTQERMITALCKQLIVKPSMSNLMFCIRAFYYSNKWRHFTYFILKKSIQKLLIILKRF